MNVVASKLIWTAALLVVTLISGFIVSQAGRPLNSLLFALHKLVAVGTLIYIAVTVVRLYRAGQMTGTIEQVAIAVTAVLFVSLVVTGALLSFEMELPAVVLRIHQVAPVLSLACSVATLYLLSGRQALA